MARSRWMIAGAALALVAVPTTSAQSGPYLIKDKDRDKNQGYQAIRHYYLEWFQEWVEEQISEHTRGLSASDLRMDEILWTDLDGNQVTVNEAVVMILGQDAPVIPGVTGDLVLDGSIVGDWRGIPTLLEEDAQGRLERANGTLLVYKNAFQAMGQHYLAARQRYDQNMSLHVQALNHGSLREGQLEHMDSAIAVYDAESARDLRRLIAIISSVDGADAARRLSEEAISLEGRVGEAAAMADRVTATPVPLPPPRFR